MLQHLKHAAAALVLRERAHLRLRLAPSDTKANAAADVLLYDAALGAALEAAFDAALPRIAAPIVPPVPETPKAPETGDLVVDELRREFPEWCTHRLAGWHVEMHRDDRSVVSLRELKGRWCTNGYGEPWFTTTVDAAEHATGLVRLSRRDALDGRR